MNDRSQAQQGHPRNLDETVRAFPLPEHFRKPAEIPATRDATWLERLEASIKNDPLKQIACTLCYLRFKDHVQLAKEICELTEAPAGSDAEVLALKFAVKLHAWAEAKFEATQGTNEG